MYTGLREGGRGRTQTRERHRTRRVLVITQVALALVLLIGAGLMIRTFDAMPPSRLDSPSPHRLKSRISIPETTPRNGQTARPSH